MFVILDLLILLRLYLCFSLHRSRGWSFRLTAFSCLILFIDLTGVSSIAADALGASILDKYVKKYE